MVRENGAAGPHQAPDRGRCEAHRGEGACSRDAQKASSAPGQLGPSRKVPCRSAGSPAEKVTGVRPGTAASPPRRSVLKVRPCFAAYGRFRFVKIIRTSFFPHILLQSLYSHSSQLVHVGRLRHCPIAYFVAVFVRLAHCACQRNLQLFLGMAIDLTFSILGQRAAQISTPGQNIMSATIRPLVILRRVVGARDIRRAYDDPAAPALPSALLRRRGRGAERVPDARDMPACPAREREPLAFAAGRPRVCAILCGLHPGSEPAWYSQPSIFVIYRFPSPFRARGLPVPRRPAGSAGPR